MNSVHHGFVLHPASRTHRGRAVVQLFGRLVDGSPFLIEDDRFQPYFFVDARGRDLLSTESGVRLEETALRDLPGQPVWRATVALPGHVPRLRDRVRAEGGTACEADVRFPYRYLIDRGLRTALTIQGEGERLASGLIRFLNPQLSPSSERVSLSTLSLDIETTPDAKRVLSWALAGEMPEEVEEVGILSEKPVAGARHHSDERALLSALAERIRALDPDVITGWNVIDFDLRVLADRADALRIPFQLGRIEGRLYIQREQRFTRQSRAEIPGRQVLDGLALVRDASIRLDDYRLETAARSLLGRGKLLQEQGGDRAQAIQELYRKDPAAFVAYNLEDARLVLDILRKEALLDLVIERSLLSGMQLDRVGASIASFDLLYLPELRARGRVAPSVDTERKRARVRGGAVLDSSPGFFSNVAVYDFKSLYPSLIRTFNLDPLAHAEPGSDPIRAPNGATFSRQDSILPGILEDFFSRRAEARKRGDRHADLAIKIMMNALFGVLGAASCRFFDPDVANAITGFGQHLLAWTRDAFQDEGVRVLYGDTDSVFVSLDPEAPLERAHASAEILRERVQAEISGRIREQYRVEPRLDLELERIYTRFWQPSVRGGSQGSKKRYAGWVDGAVDVVGLEAIRRDWPAVAGRLQLGMLTRVFTDQPVLPFVRETVEAVREGRMDRELVIRKGVRKGSVDQYTANIPPHIRAARKAGRAVGRVVHYVNTRAGPEPVLPELPFPGDIDYAYYVDRVLRPVAEAILAPLGESFEEVLGEPRQLSLL